MDQNVVCYNGKLNFFVCSIAIYNIMIVNDMKLRKMKSITYKIFLWNREVIL